MEDARRAAGIRLVIEGVRRGFPGRGGSRNAADHLAVNRQVVRQQEGVVAAIAGHVAVTDRFVQGEERFDDLAGLLRGEEPVAAVADEQPAALAAGEVGGEFIAAAQRLKRSMARESLM